MTEYPTPEKALCRITYDYIDNKPRFQEGDIVGFRGSGFLPALSRNLTRPKTPLFHYGLLSRPIYAEQDWEIIESIGKGPALGRLSWYANADYTIFRLNHTLAGHFGKTAVEKASLLGRAPYDFLLPVRMISQAVGIWVKQILAGHVPRAIPVDDFHIPFDSLIACTELVRFSYDQSGAPLMPESRVSIPAAFELAVQTGVIVPIAIHKAGKAATSLIKRSRRGRHLGETVRKYKSEGFLVPGRWSR